MIIKLIGGYVFAQTLVRAFRSHWHHCGGLIIKHLRSGDDFDRFSCKVMEESWCWCGLRGHCVGIHVPVMKGELSLVSRSLEDCDYVVLIRGYVFGQTSVRALRSHCHHRGRRHNHLLSGDVEVFSCKVVQKNWQTVQNRPLHLNHVELQIPQMCPSFFDGLGVERTVTDSFANVDGTSRHQQRESFWNTNMVTYAVLSGNRVIDIRIMLSCYHVIMLPQESVIRHHQNTLWHCNDSYLLTACSFQVKMVFFVPTGFFGSCPSPLHAIYHPLGDIHQARGRTWA